MKKLLALSIILASTAEASVENLNLQNALSMVGNNKEVVNASRDVEMSMLDFESIKSKYNGSLDLSATSLYSNDPRKCFWF